MGKQTEQDNFNDVKAAISRLAKSEILVGVPEDETARGEDITNAQIGYVSEYGQPEENIPARPWLKPGIEAAQGQINKRLDAAANAALNGDDRRVKQQMNGAGQAAVTSIKGRITAGIEPELASYTISERQRIGALGTTPLIRTGAFLNSITYVLVK